MVDPTGMKRSVSSLKTVRYKITCFIFLLFYNFLHNRYSPLSKAHDRKHKKYLDLVSTITADGFICDLTCFEVASRGLITPLTRYFLLLVLKSKKTFLGNSANWSSCPATSDDLEPFWGTEDQPLISL